MQFGVSFQRPGTHRSFVFVQATFKVRVTQGQDLHRQQRGVCGAPRTDSQRADRNAWWHLSTFGSAYLRGQPLKFDTLVDSAVGKG